MTETENALISEIETAIKLADERLRGEMGEDDFEAMFLMIRLLEVNLKSDYPGTILNKKINT